VAAGPSMGRLFSRLTVRLTGSPRITSTSTSAFRTLLSFERPRRNAWFFYVGVAPVHLENSIVA
jgi:hypothetical protein